MKDLFPREFFSQKEKNVTLYPPQSHTFLSKEIPQLVFKEIPQLVFKEIPQLVFKDSFLYSRIHSSKKEIFEESIFDSILEPILRKMNPLLVSLLFFKTGLSLF